MPQYSGRSQRQIGIILPHGLLQQHADRLNPTLRRNSLYRPGY